MLIDRDLGGPHVAGRQRGWDDWGDCDDQAESQSPAATAPKSSTAVVTTAASTTTSGLFAGFSAAAADASKGFKAPSGVSGLLSASSFSLDALQGVSTTDDALGKSDDVTVLRQELEEARYAGLM